MILDGNPWIQEKKNKKERRKKQPPNHKSPRIVCAVSVPWRSLYTFPHTSSCSICSMHVLHCSCCPFLQHNICMCQCNLAVWILYPSFPHISPHSWRNSNIWRTYFKACKRMTSFFFCECLYTYPTRSDKSRQQHTPSQSTWMCITGFYWAAPEVSYVETEEQCSVFVQMQLPSNDFANHKDIFHCCCLSYNENALSKSSGSTLTILQQVMKVPANQ